MYYDKNSSNISYNQEKVKNKHIKLFQWLMYMIKYWMIAMVCAWFENKI